MKINYDNRHFVGKSNTTTGEVSASTTFHYRQSGDILTATYHGGQVIKGHMIGKVETNGHLHFYYHHINEDGELKSGECHSIPEVLDDGRIRLHESWKWFGAGEGTSIVEEIKAS